MANGNTVTITLAGDPKPAEDAFKRVSKASDDAGKHTEDSFDRAKEKTDELDTKSMGFRDTLTGIQDGTKGIKQAADGNWGFDTLLLLGTGVGDLASGFTNFLIPATKAMKIEQLGLNLAFLSSPLTWIILAIIALIVIIVLIATKTTWFQDIWKKVWGGIKDAAHAVGSWFKDTLWNKWIKGAFDAISDKVKDLWDWFKKAPGRLKDFFKDIAGFITAPFKAAFNLISDLWNNTIGRLSWTIPSWIPGIGGKTISAPQLPKFHSGGTVPGAPGSEMLAILQAGEKVTPAGQSAATVIEIHSGGSELDDLLVRILGNAIKSRGSSAQMVLVGHE